jgi:hypothetical protein
LISIRIAATCSLWLAAGALGCGRRKAPLACQAVLAGAAAVSAAVLADHLQLRRRAQDGDRATASVLAALEIDRRMARAEEAAGEQRHLRLVGRDDPALPGRAGDDLVDRAADLPQLTEVVVT